jgi:hypothetical protein
MGGRQPTPQGMKESSPGYQASRWGDGKVEVEFRQSWSRINSGEELAAQMLARYREAIEAAGFKVTEGTGAFRDSLIVTATDPDAEEAAPNG